MNSIQHSRSDVRPHLTVTVRGQPVALDRLAEYPLNTPLISRICGRIDRRIARAT